MPTTKQRGEPSWLVITVVLTCALAGAAYFVLSGRPTPERLVKVPERKAAPSPTAAVADVAQFTKFADERDFRAWLAKGGEEQEASRKPVAKTLKTDESDSWPKKLRLTGSNIFYASAAAGRSKSGALRIVKAWPMDDLGLTASLEKSGDTLIAGNTLVVMTTDGFQAYDVKDTAKPVTTWRYGLGDGQALRSVSTMEGELVVITEADVNRRAPCPVRPLASAKAEVTVPCESIWHPLTAGKDSALLSVVVIDMATGEVKRVTAVAGEHEGLEATATKEGLVAAAALPVDELATAIAFAKEKPEIFPAEVTRELERLQGYDLTPAAKTLQVDAVIGNWFDGLSETERAATQNLIASELPTFWNQASRAVVKTALMRLDFSSFDLKVTGTVPGRLRSADSLDAHGGFLRAYTTFSGQPVMPKALRLSWTDDVGDLYVLDENLKAVSEVFDAPRGQGVATARFMGSKALMASSASEDGVTVIDLGDPRNPKIAGRLPLPGNASYLHRISDTRLLGVGKEGSQVKISLLDVSGEPKELARYALDEYWTDIEGTHAAFALDAARQVFFLPASRGGYVMSFEGDTLGIVTPVSGLRVSRSAFASGMLYLAGEDKLTVVSATTWKRTMQVTWPVGR